MSVAGNVVLAIAAHRQKTIDRFLSERADCPERALDAASIESDGYGTLDRLRQENILRATADGRLYLDRAQLASASAMQRRGLAIVFAVFGLVAVVAAIIAWWAAA